MGDHKTPKIFSTENYERIITEQQKAMHEVSPKLLAKLKSEEDLSRFFYDYKNMSISSSSLYRVGKTQDQLKEDKAVQMFFRKLVENAKLAKKPKNDEIRQLREIQRYDQGGFGHSDDDPTDQLDFMINKMDEQHKVLSKIKSAKRFDQSLERQERIVEKTLKTQEEYIKDFINKNPMKAQKVREIFRRHDKSSSMPTLSERQRKLKAKQVQMEDERNLIKLFELAKKAKADKMAQKRYERLSNGQDTLVGTVNESLRLNLVHLEERKAGGIMFKPSSLANMIHQIESQYSSEHSQEAAEEKQKKVKSIMKSNIKRETAEEKIENMLGIQFIKATDVTH